VHCISVKFTVSEVLHKSIVHLAKKARACIIHCKVPMIARFIIVKYN